MSYARIVLIMILAIFSVSVSADKKKKVWRTDSAYLAQRYATIQAMDSVLKNVSGTDALMHFADMKCKEFDNDPVLMRAIASSFATRAGLIDLSVKRYQKIKESYPQDFESYSNYAATLFDFSIKVKPEGNLERSPEWFQLAKAQMDSAKVALPKSKAPYLWWLERCTRYAYNDSLIKSFQDEVEAYRKAFPDDNADFVAANYLGDADIEMNMSNFSKLYDEQRELQDYLRADAEEYRRREAQKYFDKIDIHTLPLDNLYQLTLFYYRSTESKFLGRDGRALLHEKGLEQASLGTEKYPEEKNFSRLQLWHAAELAKTYDFRINQAKKNKDADLQAKETANRDTTAAQGLIGAETLMSKTDTLLRQDYYFAGVVNQFKGKYDEAIELYKKAMGPLRNIEAKLPYRAPFHNCDSLTIYQNMVDCYSRANHHEEAIAQINALCDLKTQHGQSRNINDYVDLVSQYRAIGNDTLKIQSERFAAYVAVDSLFACIQDSIDAGSDNFPFQEGRVGYYPYQRMLIRMRMNSLSDYKERDNYLYLESAEDVVRRIEVVVDKSSIEKDLISNAAVRLWSSYYNMKDYKSCLRYQTILSKYDPETADTYKKNFEFARRHAR